MHAHTRLSKRAALIQVFLYSPPFTSTFARFRYKLLTSERKSWQWLRPPGGMPSQAQLAWRLCLAQAACGQVPFHSQPELRGGLPYLLHYTERTNPFQMAASRNNWQTTVCGSDKLSLPVSGQRPQFSPALVACNSRVQMRVKGGGVLRLRNSCQETLR